MPALHTSPRNGRSWCFPSSELHNAMILCLISLLCRISKKYYWKFIKILLTKWLMWIDHLYPPKTYFFWIYDFLWVFHDFSWGHWTCVCSLRRINQRPKKKKKKRKVYFAAPEFELLTGTRVSWHHWEALPGRSATGSPVQFAGRATQCLLPGCLLSI